MIATKYLIIAAAVLIVGGYLVYKYVLKGKMSTSTPTMVWDATNGWQGGFTLVKVGSYENHSMYVEGSNKTEFVSWDHVPSTGWDNGNSPTPGSLLYNGSTPPTLSIPSSFSTISYGGTTSTASNAGTPFWLTIA